MQEIKIPSLDKINETARDFLASLNGQTVIALYGEMGAGKTTFVKAICNELQVADNVTSPTFAIVNEYTSGVSGEPIFHFDFYRIKNMEEVYDIGYEEYIDSGYLCLMEWPELIEPLLPDDCLKVKVSH